MRHLVNHLVIFIERVSHCFNITIIEKENVTYNFSKADYRKERNFEVPLHYNDISPISQVKSQFTILSSNEYLENIAVVRISKTSLNPVHESLEWLKFVDDTNSTNAKALKKSSN